MTKSIGVKSPILRLGLGCLVALLSLSLPIVAFVLIKRDIRHRQEDRFNAAATLVFENSKHEIFFFLKLLQGLGGLFVESIPKPQEVRAYLKSIDIKEIERTSSLEGVGLVWHVTPENEQQFVAFFKNRGVTNTIRAWLAGSRAEYPIVAFESDSTNAMSVTGWDVGQDPLRKAALRRALETGQPALTPKLDLHLPGKTEGVQGFILYLPIFDGGAIPDTLAGRESNLLGFIFGSFNSTRFFRGEVSDPNPILDLEVFDHSLTKANLLYDQDAILHADLTQGPPYPKSIQMDLFGRTWIFHFTELPALWSPAERTLPWLVLWGGMLFSLGFLSIVYLQTHGRSVAEALNTRLQTSSRELKKSKEAVEAALVMSKKTEDELAQSLSLQIATIESTGDGILVVNRQKKIVSLNHRFASMWSFPEEILASRNDEKMIAHAMSQLVDPEVFIRRVNELYELPEQESFDEIILKNGRIFERYSRPQKAGSHTIGRVWSFRDVTERRQAEQSLMRREKQYRDLVETSHDLIWAVDAEGKWTFVNQAARNIYGFEPSEMLGRSFTEFETPMQAAKDLTTFRQVKEGNPVYRYITQHRRKDGSSVWLSFNAIASRDEEGRILGTTGTARNITAQREVEEKLQDSQVLYQSLVETLPQCIFRKDLSGNYTFANPAFCRLLRLQMHDILDHDDFDLFPAEIAREYLESDREAMKSGGFVEHTELFKGWDSGTRYVNVVKAPLHDGRGEMLGIQGIFWDITEKKLADDNLAGEKERLAVTLRSIGDAVITTDISGHVILMNEVAETLSGWRQQEAAGEPLDKIFNLYDHTTKLPLKNLAQLAQNHNDPQPARLLLHTRTGREIVLQHKAAPIHDHDGAFNGAVFVFRDITETLKLEAELLKSTKLESIGLLAGGIAHDFNNILTAIIGNVSFLKFTAALNEDARIRLDEVQKASFRARELTQQLLTFAKGGAPVKHTEDILEIIRDSTDFALRGANVRADYSFAPDLSPAEVDAGQISQVIQNLVINAKQAMPDGGVVEISARNSTIANNTNLPLRPGKYLEILVRDHGIGISGDNLPRIFDPYFTTKSSGTGLGLATSYSIIKRHEGLITVQSEPGKGTTFQIYLPAAAAGTTSFINNVRPQEKLSKGIGRILVMDDEPPIRALTTAILRHFGYEITAVADGAAALREYAASAEAGKGYDVVIMDLTVPGGMGGREAIQELLRLDPDAQAIVSSGYSNDPVMADFRRFGFKAMVEKPYKMEELALVVQQILATRQQKKPVLSV